MGKKKNVGATPAIQALNAAQVPFTAIEYSHHDDNHDFGAEAAKETGVDPAQMYKTLVVTLGPGKLAVGVVPVSGHLDLKAIAATLGVKKADMAEPRVAERSTGYVVGGVSPVGQRTPLPTVIDASARAWDVMYVSGGKRGLQIAVAPADLSQITGAVFADIAAP